MPDRSDVASQRFYRAMPEQRARLSLRISIPDEMMPRAEALAAARNSSVEQIVMAAAMLGAELER
jgi:hypothetical protein